MSSAKAKPTSVDGRVDFLLAALHKFGMSVSRAAAAEIIGERVRRVSSQMCISPTAARRHLTDHAIADLAPRHGHLGRDETPGADVTESTLNRVMHRPRFGQRQRKRRRSRVVPTGGC